MTPWWENEVEEPGLANEATFLVVEAKLHDPSGLKQKFLERMAVLVSEAVRELLSHIPERLTIRYDENGKLEFADLSFLVSEEHAERIKRLLAQKKFDKEGQPRVFSNAYRFVSCESENESRFRAVSRLATRITRITDKGTTRHLSTIPATIAFQQLLLMYFAPQTLSHLPRSLRPGVCQEVAQQATSYIGQLNSKRVKGEVSFPTVESRDPAVRHREFVEAIDALGSDWRPLERSKLRDLYPAEFKDDDPRGDRLVVSDERWLRIIRSAEPSLFSLFFVTGDMVKILQSEKRIAADVSMMNRYAGIEEHNPQVLAARPKQIRGRGYTTTKLYWAALPLTDCGDEQVQDYLKQIQQQQSGLPSLGNRRKVQRRAIRLSAIPQKPENLQPCPITRQTRIPKQLHEQFILVPLLGNHDRLERVLNRSDVEIAWTRVVKKSEEWYLQLTLRVPVRPTIDTARVLGVSFGLDAVATWCLVDNASGAVEQGHVSPNPQILAFLEQKQHLESRQKRQRWIGGRGFGKRLGSIAHRIANDLVELALTNNAMLAVEDISYVQKSGPDSAKNVLFSAWNYGQLRRLLEYKSQLVGLGEPLFVSDFLVAFTCPECGARRKPKQQETEAETWIKDGVLHCRKCNFAETVNPGQKALRVCAEGQILLQNRRH